MITFDEAIEQLSEWRPVHARDVYKNALSRKVWVAEWRIPGCLSESRSITTTKANAIDACLQFTGDDPPRGMLSALRQHERYVSHSPLYGQCVNTVECMTLGDLCL